MSTTTQSHTAHGTPCSPRWDDDWIQRIEAVEQKLNRPICGARCIDGTPCTHPSNHKNGRCPFHGGFDLTGAQPGNRNAVIHGLYSRRIQRCGPHCPMWKHCPLATKHVLEMPEAKRPKCPYEQAEYNAVTSDLTTTLERAGQYEPDLKHEVSNIAMVQVLLTRAANALGVSPMFYMTTQKANGAFKANAKNNPIFDIFFRLLRESRYNRQRLPQSESHSSTVNEAIEWQNRVDHDTDLTPEAQAKIHKPEEPRKKIGQSFLNSARDYAGSGSREKFIKQLTSAFRLIPETTQKEAETLLKTRHPEKREREKTAQTIFDQLCTTPP